MTQISFSVILPTYNRASYLPNTIKSILKQDLKNFELIILDDASTDNTEDVIEKIKDKRIKFIKNKKNIRVAANVKKGFLMAKGKYIFTLGDDDIIVRSDTFSFVYREMERKKAGFGQTGLMYFESDFRKPSSLDHVSDEIIYLPPSDDIILKTANWHYGFISGNIFRRDLMKASDILDNDIWWIYFKYVYRALKTAGGMYFGKYFIAAKISTTGNISYIDIKHNKQFHLKKLFEIYRQFDRSPERFALFKKNRLDTVVTTLPGIKYYTSNINIRLIVNEVLKWRPAYRYSLVFWYYYILSIILPKNILGQIRRIRLKLGEISLSLKKEHLGLYF